VLTSTLPATLTVQGVITDPDTGLVYLGDGRYYDPMLGRPLQPNPAGGPPTVPQALNRYAATPLGQPGVAEGVESEQPWLVEYAMEEGSKQAIERSITTVGGKLGISEAFEWARHPNGLQYVMLQGERRAFKGIFSKLTVIQETEASAGVYWDMALSCGPTPGQRLRYAGQALLVKLGLGSGYDEVIAEGVIPVRSSLPPELRALKLTPLLERVRVWRWLGIGLEVGASVAADMVIQGVSDAPDPYLSQQQKDWRLVIAGVGGALSGAAGIGGTLVGGPWVGVGAAAGIELIWNTAATPFLYQQFSLVTERKLQPLRGGE
jgi:hypothetical protein